MSPPSAAVRRCRPTRAGAAVVAALAVATLVAGCGVRTRTDADRADPADVPFGLLDPDRPSSLDPDGRSGTPVEVYVYDASAGRLTRVVQVLSRADLGSVLDQLEQAPGGFDIPAGNPLDDADVIAGAEVSRGLATVDLRLEFSELTGANQLVALAEIVYTATGRPGVGQVAFTLDGQPVEVPRGDGSLTAQPLTRADYPDVAP